MSFIATKKNNSFYLAGNLTCGKRGDEVEFGADSGRSGCVFTGGSVALALALA